MSNINRIPKKMKDEEEEKITETITFASAY